MAHDNTSHPPLEFDRSDTHYPEYTSGHPGALTEYTIPADTTTDIASPHAPPSPEENKFNAIKVNWMFPLDIERPEGHPFVEFTLEKYSGMSYDTNERRRQTQDLLHGNKSVGDRIGDFAEDAVNQAKGVIGKNVRSASDSFLDRGPRGDLPAGPWSHETFDQLQLHDDTKYLKMVESMSVPQVNIAGHIKLFLPLNVQETYSLKWAEGDIGQGGALIQTGWDSVRDLIENSGLVGKEMLGRLAARGFNTPEITDLVLRNQGAAVNNHLEAFFKGVNFRKFSYNFQFFPKSSEEAIAAAKIIRYFKAAAAPELKQPGETYGRYWVYPNQFRIKYWNAKATHQIGRCYLDNISVNYSAAGTNQTFVDGYPLQTDLTLNFTEMEVIHKGQIMEGY